MKFLLLSLLMPLYCITTAVCGEQHFGPIHGCTFYNELESEFWGCASPRINKRSCNKRKCIGPICHTYKGDRGYMHRPAFLIEVTTNWGKSLFAKAFPKTLGVHLQAARHWYKKRSGPSSRFTDGGGIDLSGGSIFWHARVLPVPFAMAAFAYSDMPPIAKASTAFPSCYFGVSEFIPDQWNRGGSDLPFAAAWSPIGIRQCMGAATSVVSSEINHAIGNARTGASKALGAVGDIPGGETFGLGCAYGVPPNILLAQNLRPTSDALNYRKLCMGQLGGLLPREGLISNTNPFRSAVMAAWKFASLTKDSFFDSVGGIEDGDKWQLVWPKAAQSGCVDPKRMVTDWFIPGPLEVRNPVKEQGQTYVFAIWRESRTNNCYEPETAKPFWKDLIKGPNYQAIRGACKL